MANHHQGHEGPCPNCSHPLTADDRFCPRCGQENHSLKIPIGHLLYETVEGIFHFDNKFFRTLWQAVTRPGLIVHDFLEGRRARYVPPIRLYIFVSVIFFFLLNKWVNRNEGSPPSVRFSKPERSGISVTRTSDSLKPKRRDTRLSRGSEINIGETVITLGGVTTNLPENLTAGFQINRGQHIGERGIEARGVAPAELDALPYAKRIDVFLDAVRDTLMRWPDTTVFVGWIPSRYDTARTLQFSAWKTNLDTSTIPHLRSALASTDDPDTLLPSIRNGKVYLHYQPRFLGVPSDSASMEAYTRLKSRKEIDAVFEQWGRHPDFWERLFFSRTVYFYKAVRDNESDDMFQKLWIPLFMKYISLSVFLLMPLAGFLLLMIFYKQRRYYYEHLIFSIYSHAFAFIIFSIALGLSMIFRHTALENAVSQFTFYLSLSVLAYFVLSLKRVYGQGWIRTLLKSLVVMGLYSVSLITLALAMFVLSLATF